MKNVKDKDEKVNRRERKVGEVRVIREKREGGESEGERGKRKELIEEKRDEIKK